MMKPAIRFYRAKFSQDGVFGNNECLNVLEFYYTRLLLGFALYVYFVPDISSCIVAQLKHRTFPFQVANVAEKI